MWKPRTIARTIGELGARAQLPLRLALWDGETVDLGPAPRVTIRLPDRSALQYLTPPSIANLAAGYVTGRFDVDGRLDDVIEAAAGLARAGLAGAGRARRALRAVTHSRNRDAQAISHHYDVSNDFYRLWLDPQMVYSCAYFRDTSMSLAAAQTAKLDHILAKIMLRPGERLLDIGCGWGALAIRAAQRYGARVTGVTLSKNQAELARERVRAMGLEGRVDIRLMDYRDVEGPFEKITSVGMFEHVGLKNLRAYFGRIRDLLVDGGLALNHGITSTDTGNAETPFGAGEFIERYVFPHGELPHISRVLADMQDAGLEALDVENLRRHYARTLRHWADNYEGQSDRLHQIVGETTWRVWRIYLAGCAYAFAQDWISIYQVLVCKAGPEGLNPTPWTRHYMYAGEKA